MRDLAEQVSAQAQARYEAELAVRVQAIYDPAPISRTAGNC
jgi:hypothetical protein